MDRAEYEPEQLMRELRDHGITDERVLLALGKVRRERFVGADQQALAYRNAPLPIGEGQTISQPFVVAFMLQQLRLRGGERVLEVGTGSGYQTALLAELAGRIISIERHASLAAAARELLAELGYARVQIIVSDGTLGWREGAPYDAIVVSAAAPDIPTPLVEQLANGGRLILPVGSMTSQELVLLKRENAQIVEQKLGPVRFVPLVGEQGWGGRGSAN